MIHFLNQNTGARIQKTVVYMLETVAPLPRGVFHVCHTCSTTYVLLCQIQ